VPEIVEAEVPSRDECVIAMLAHVLMIFSWFWAPLIVYFAKRDSRFVTFHALQALYWQILVFCGWILSIVALIIVVTTTVGFSSVGAQAPSQMLTPTAFFLLFWLVFMGGWVLNLVLGIVFGIKASHGEWTRYPLLGRLALRHAKVRKQVDGAV
jgi:uncharacterized Tic20 family protein